MTQDEKKLLKHGLFWAIVVPGFWYFVLFLRSRVVTVIAMIIWWAAFYWIFYRDAHKQKLTTPG